MACSGVHNPELGLNVEKVVCSGIHTLDLGLNIINMKEVVCCWAHNPELGLNMGEEVCSVCLCRGRGVDK